MSDYSLEFDRSTHCLLRIRPDDSLDVVRLTPLEARLVEHMFGRNRLDGGRPVVCRYRELTAAVWPDREHDDSRPYLSGLVFELRKKIERDASAPRLLTTVAGEGYALVVRPFSAVRRTSPFIAGPPVADPACFFGRTREVDRIFGLWTHRPLHSAIVMGPRRSGKTSLLCYLEALPRTAPADLRPGQRPCPLPHSAGAGAGTVPGAYRLAFISFQDPRARHADWVFGEILRAFGLRLDGTCAPDVFVECIESQLDSPAVVLLDEIERGMRHSSLDDLWGTLRSTASHRAHQRLAFVVACTTPPTSEAESSFESPLLNIISDCVTLGPLTPAEADELIASTPRPFPPDDVAWILDRSGRWPALLQLFCLARWRSLEREERSDDWKRYALERAHPLRHLLSR